MPDLFRLTGTGTDPVLTSYVTGTPQVEPLDGPISVDDVMDRFPEEVYHQGRDTHLYRFLTALCGDSGAALLKKQAFISRLRFEAEFLNFRVLDDFYTSNFSFRRLKSETYTQDPNAALTPAQWDSLHLADQSYKHRLASFFNASRHGNTPEGLRLAATAGSGLDVEIVEHYRYIYDQYSDDKLGLTPYGVTTSTAEYVVIPRILNSGVGAAAQTYTRTFSRSTTFTAPTLDGTQKPVPAPVGGNAFSVASAFTQTSSTQLLPEIERNTIDILDRLGSVTTVPTFALDEVRYTPVAVKGTPFASSERIHVNRFVQGATGVAWPVADQSKNYFIQAGVENESGYYFGGAREYPVVFHTAEGIHGYTEKALTDPTYSTGSGFYDTTIFAPFNSYRSEHIGNFLSTLAAIYTFLQTVPTDTVFVASNALAIQNTPLVLEGAAT